MTTLTIKFRGLCLFHKKGNEIGVYLPNATGAKNGEDGKELHAHDVQLWLVKGSLKTGRGGGADKSRPVILDGVQRTVRYFDLDGNWQIRILNEEDKSQAGTALTLPPGLPSLSAHETLVDPNKGITGTPAATFWLDRGSLQGHGEIKLLNWAGSHVGGNPIMKVPEYIQLTFATEDEDIEIGNANRRLVFSPVDGQDEVSMIVGAEPQNHPHDPHVGDHFKWFYDLVDLRAAPHDLAYPIAQPPIKFTVPSGSSFCPDSQYP